MNCDTSHIDKPPVVPRKVKKTKPPIPPRRFGPYANYSEHDTMATSIDTTPTSATGEGQDVANSVTPAVHDGHQKQMKTHEMVVLKRHPKYVRRYSKYLAIA